VDVRIYLVIGCILAAVGQVFFKLGVNGTSGLTGFVNLKVATGLVSYGLGTLLWLMALAKLPLSKVYPFTILTFLMVYVASFAMLGEKISPSLLVGSALIISGLIVIAVS
jgi:drug/metabolite transporter (DMT)-like permease